MVKLIVSQIQHRWRRTAALALGILVAALSFSLLTASVATSALRVRSLVNKNFRSSYDILVRPAGSQTPIEAKQDLVRPNYLSGTFGGISLKQYQQIQGVPGVEVAAPIANIGYILPLINLPIDLTNLLTPARAQLFRIRAAWHTDRGLSTYPDADTYVYVTRNRFLPGANYITEVDPATGRESRVCNGFNPPVQGGNPFELTARTFLFCWSTADVNATSFQTPALPPGHIGTAYDWQFPILLAAIDPVQEARLLGLDRAVVSGRYLTPGDEPRVVAPPGAVDSVRDVPTLAVSHSYVDELYTGTIERLTVRDPQALPSILASSGAYRYLRALPGQPVRRITSGPEVPYEQLVSGRLVSTGPVWTTGATRYLDSPAGGLRALAVNNPLSVWASDLSISGLAPVPLDSQDVQFRRLTNHDASNRIRAGVLDNPILRIVGRFDASRLPGFSPLSRLPLESYDPPAVAPGDAATVRALADRPLLPSLDIGGYIAQPPLFLTTLSALPLFTNPAYFNGVSPTAPISVIRVRVGGVTGPNSISRERIRAVAEQIVRRTGLTVDLTAGSSPHPLTVTLPAGRYGRPALVLREGWVQKGVAVALVTAVDKKSLAVFALVLVVCGFFLLNAAIAAVRARRVELGVLSSIGWPARRIFALIELELVLIGLLAGVLGSGLGLALARAFGLSVGLGRILLVTPVAVVLAAVAGLWPAWKAASVPPMAAVLPAVAQSRRPSRVGSVTGLALTNLRRLPGRTLLGSASLLVGVAALALLGSITAAFHGTLVGNLLGGAVSVQVRGVDYLAVGLTLLLGALSVADVLYLNVTERTEELAALASTGWGESHLRRMLGVEALGMAVTGSALGAVLGATAAGLAGIPLPVAVVTGGAAAAAGILAALAASLVPLARLGRLAPAAALATE